jgi:hypothetical protein
MEQPGQKLPSSLLKSAQSLKPLRFVDFSKGLVTKGAVSENIAPKTSVSEVGNMNFDIIGGIQIRKGITKLGNTLTGNILGLYNYLNSSNSNNQLITVNGNSVYYLSGINVWTQCRTGLSLNSARFTTFLNFVWMVNGSEATAIWDGNPSDSFLTTGNALSAPVGKYIENYRSRVWISGNTTYPGRVYYSSVPSAAATPVITWNTDPVTGTWIDVAPQDGENITGLKRSKYALLVFKNNHIYRIYSVNSSEPDPQINVGTYSQESIVEAVDGIYFHHPSGFWKYSTDGTITLISKSIKDLSDAITLTNASQVCGWEDVDKDHIYWAVGTITLSTVGKKLTYNNVVLRYSISSQLWTMYTYQTQFLVSSGYNNGSSLFKVVGDNNGMVFEVNTGNTDNGSDIPYWIVHKAEELDGLSSTTGIIDKIIFLHTGGAGTKVTWQKQEDTLNDYTRDIGNFKSFDTFFDSLSIKSRNFYFNISGSSKGDSILYEGFEVLGWYNELDEYENP